jgi:hypothetical protein
LKDRRGTRKPFPPPAKIIIQQGDLILTKTDSQPANLVEIQAERLPDGGVPLGEGYFAYGNVRLFIAPPGNEE